MKMYTRAFNDKREATEYINEHGIKKENIVTIFQDNDGLFVVMYYEE